MTKRRSLLMAMILLVVATCAHAQDTDLKRTLGMLPNTCSLVIGCADTQKTVGAIKKWGEPVASKVLPEPMKDMLLWAMDSIGTTINGSAVFGLLDEKGAFVFILESELAPNEIAKIFNEHLDVASVGEFVVFGPPRRPWLYCTVRKGYIIASNSRETLNRFLGEPVEPERSILVTEDGAKFLLREDVANASLFAFKRPGLIGGFDPFGTRGRARTAAAIGERMLAATHIGWLVQSPSLACLTVNDAAVSLKTTVLLPEEASLPEKRGVAQSSAALNLSSAWPLRISGRHNGFSSLMDALERAMERFDPDVAAEYREEMGELDRDLGYDFRKDFMDVLGGRWELGIRPSAAGGEVDWTLVCELLDRDRFVASAAKLAEISSEPWSEAPSQSGALWFKSRAFTLPLEIGVTKAHVVVGSSSRPVQEALRVSPGVPAKTMHAHRDSLWDIEAALRIKEFIRPLPRDAVPRELMSMISNLPESCTVTLRVERKPGEFVSELSIEGMGSAAISSSVAVQLREARERARRKSCMNNISQILMACWAYEADRKHFPRKLSDLLTGYIANKKVLQCPSARGARQGNGDSSSSYRYLGGMDTRTFDMSSIVVYDLKQNHVVGRNVGYLDGHVSWIEERAFAAELERSLKSVTLAIEGARKQGKNVQVDMKRIEAFHHDQPMPE